MTTRADLEAALAANFDRAHLAVYGDYLLSIGDPRGELIAIDLHDGDEERKLAVLWHWLGDEVAGHILCFGTFEFGFLELRVTAQLRDALPLALDWAGEFLYSLAIDDDADGMQEVLAMVASAPRPWLHRLDLSAREPAPRVPKIIAERATLPIRSQLRWLRVPSLRGDAELDALERAIADMPGDAEIVVARAYEGFAPTRALPPRVKVPPPRPWPPPDAVRVSSNHNVFAIAVPNDPVGEDFDVREAAALTDRNFDALPASARDAWLELWDTLAIFSWATNAETGFSRAALAAALAPLDLDDHPRWLDLRATLARCTDELVTIRGQWGWR
jgi:hypothetical protein